MKFNWTTSCIRDFNYDVVVCPSFPAVELVSFVSATISALGGNELQDKLQELKKRTFEFGHATLIESLRQDQDLIVAFIQKQSSQYKFSRSTEASLYCAYINCLHIANGKKVKHLALPILSLEDLNFPEQESMLCAMYGMLSYFLMNPTTTIEEITVHFGDSSSLARFAALLPECGSELILEDAVSINAQRRRLIDIFRPSLNKISVFEKNGISFGTFVKKYANKNEKRTIVTIVDSIISQFEPQCRISDISTLDNGTKRKKRMQERRTNSDFRLAEIEARKKRRQDPDVREQESSARKKRREDPEVRSRDNNATKIIQRLRRLNSTVREQENTARKTRRQDPNVREQESSARKQRREDPEVRSRENSSTKKIQRLRRLNSTVREQEYTARKTRRQDPDVREQESSARKKRRKDPEVRSRDNSATKIIQRLRRLNSTVREQENTARKTRRQDPDVRDAENRARNERREDPDVRERENNAAKEKKRSRRSDPLVRLQENTKNNQRRRNDEARRKENEDRQQRRNVPEIRQKEHHLARERYRLNPLKRAKRWILNLFKQHQRSSTTMISERNTSINETTTPRHNTDRESTARRRLFPSAIADSDNSALNMRIAEMSRKARTSMKQKKEALGKKAIKMHRICKSTRLRARRGIHEGSTGLVEARRNSFLGKLCRPQNSAYASSLRLPLYSAEEHNNDLMKIIVAQLVLRPRNMLTKEFVDAIVKESREIYTEGSQMHQQLTIRLRKEQAYLQKAMEHRSKELTSDQIIGGLRIHVKTCDRQPRKSYVPLEKLFLTPGEVPGLFHEQMSRRSTEEVEEILDSVDENDEIIVHHMLNQVIDRISLDKNAVYNFNPEQEENIIRKLLNEMVETISHNDISERRCDDLQKHTYGSLCDNSCVLPKCDWSFIIPLKLKKICDPGKSARVLLQELSSITYCEYCEDGDCENVATCDNIKSLLAELAPHCQNVRTIIRRFYEIRRICAWIYKWEVAVASSDLHSLYEIVKQTGYLGEQPVNVVSNFQSENYVNKKFYKMMEKCRQKISNHEIYPCFSCTILYSKDKIKKISSSMDIAAPIIKGLAKVPAELMICTCCRESLRKGKVPVLFTGNGLEIPFLPGELQNLNWLETLLIRKVRPIMATFLLAPLRGPGLNQMRGFKGSVLHLPVEIEKSVNHVIKHLPSAEGLDIIVNTTPKSVVQKLLEVDMEKVIRALLWLKANNEEYKDIDIKATFNPIEELISKTLDCDPNLEATQIELEQLRLLSQGTTQGNEGDHLLSLVTQHFALTNIDPPNPDPLASKRLFNLNQMEGEPVNALEKNLDVKVFPELFPTGKFGMHQQRKIPVSETLFLRRCLRSRFSQFRRNLTYIFFQANRKDVKSILGSASIMVKKLTGTTSIFDRIAQKDSSIDDLLSTMFTNVRSHQEYWANVKRELRTKISYFGPPTFFVTLNPAEYEWTELRDYYKALYPNMKKTIGEFVEMDPLIFARHFTKRISAVTTEMIFRRDGIFGEVTHHFWRMEYQRRGAPHVHMLVWVKGAPQIGRESNEEVAAFIDEHISCATRESAKEPTLAELVKRFQVHRQPCTDTCKIVRKVGKKRIESCRFMYPIETSSETVVLSEEERKSISSTLRMKKGYLLKRSSKERFINAYNCALLMIWRGNVDIQMVSTTSLKYVDYVTSYVGKSESKNLLDGIDLARSKCSVKDLVGFAIKFMKNREMGAAEAVDRCLGHKLYHSDTDVMWLHTNSKNERMRRLKTSKEMAATEEGGSETADNFIDVYYPKRSQFLEQCSLFNIFMNYKVVSKLPEKIKECKTPVPDGNTTNIFEKDGWETVDRSSCFFQHPPNLAYPISGTKKWLLSRTKPILPRMYWPNCDEGPDEQECWSRRVLLVFKPWRDEDQLKNSDESYFDAYHKFIESVSVINKSQINRLLNAAEDLTAALLEKKKDYEEIAKIRKELGINEAEALEIQDITTTPEEVIAGENRLNEGQRIIYDKIMKAVESDDAFRKDSTLAHTPLCIFTSGVGGTGKTAVIHQLSAKITLNYSVPNRSKEEPAILLAAPTGLAALAIRGNTLHSLLQLGTDNSTELSNAKQSELAVLFRNCRLLIIDEISMVSNIMLFKICLRLTEIKNNSQAFGGLNVAVFGDLLQLPPVRARDVFERLSTKEVKRVFHSVALNYPLWDHFEYGELTQNMRQQEDLSFAETLGRIRIGSPTETDIKLLLSRMISTKIDKEPLPDHHAPRSATMEEAAQYYVEKWKGKEDIVALFSKVDTVNEFNETVHTLLGLEVEEIRAVDVIQKRVSRKKGQRSRPYQQVGFRRKDWGRTKSSLSSLLKRKRKEGLIEGIQGGLPDKLRVAVNSRVMLRRNIDVSIGLVNGAMGLVKELISDHKNRVINIMVKFDNIDDIVGIEKMNVPFDISGELFASRTQFPLLVAYAVTIHKAQGMTATHVLASIEDTFAKGMSYVALSRATSLKGVHLMGFYPKKISASVSALSEYKRLREKIKMDPLPEGNILPQLRINFHSARNRKKRVTTTPVTVDEEENYDAAHTITTNSTRIPRAAKTRGTSKARTQLKKLAANNTSLSASVVQKRGHTMTLRHRKSNQRLLNQSQRFIWFNNRGSDCFVNTVVWSILNSVMGVRISRGDEANLICAYFEGLGAAGFEFVQSTAQLRELFPQFLEGSHAQHDAVDFYRDLVANLPEIVSKQMTVKKTTALTCTACMQETRVESDSVAAELCMYSSTFSGILEQMTTTSMIREHCPTCGESMRHIQTVEYDAFLTKLIVLEFGWADEGAKVLNRPDIVQMFDEEWKLVAAVEYIAGGRNGESGHYISWVKRDDNWFTLDDQKSKEEQQDAFKADHSGIKLMFFQKTT